MKRTVLILLLLLPFVLWAQQYSGITIEPDSIANHYIAQGFVNDTLYDRIHYFCEVPVDVENFVILQKEGKLIRDGISVQFFPSGNPEYLITFSKGQIHGPIKKFYASGKIKTSAEWINGKPSGSFVSYFENGIEQVECTFVNGAKEGVETIYHENGTKRAILNYQSGTLHGKQKTFHSNGKKKASFQYEKNTDMNLVGLEHEQLLKKPKLFSMPLNTLPLENLLINNSLPDKEKENTIVKIDLVLLIGTDARVKDVLNYGTSSDKNIPYLTKLLDRIDPFDTVFFDGKPIEYVMTLPLRFYNGNYISTCQGRMPAWELTNVFGESFWIPSFHFKTRFLKNPGQDETPLNLADMHDNKSEDPDSIKTFLNVEVMPIFPGGEQALKEFIGRSIRYPVEAAKRREQGRVYIQFIVDVDGLVTGIKVARGVSPLLDAEAVRVVKSLPRWKPGIQKGKPVRVSYTVPISFKLQ